jgi:hypothetical protein
MSLAAVAAIGGTALSAVGAIAQGAAAERAAEAEARAAEFNARIAEQQAAREREAAAVEAEDFRRREGAKRATARAARGASGVTMAGSPLLVDEATVREIALGSSRLINQGAVRGTRLEQDAELSRMSGRTARQRGKNARTAGFINAGTTLLSGASDFATSRGMF